MIVSELERALLARYPKTDAEPWDHVGLSVGDATALRDRLARDRNGGMLEGW